MTCVKCRMQRYADHLVVPCDVGGLIACWAWQVYGASPGVRDDPDDLFALMLYNDGRRLGLEMALQFRHVELSECDAEHLLLRLEWLTENYPLLEQAFAQVQQG